MFLNVLSFTNCPLNPNSGSGKTVLSYTQGLRQLGHSVDVAAPQDYESWMHFGGRVKKFRQAWGAWNFVQQKLKANDYDLIEFYGDEFWLVAQQLSKKSPRPLLVAHTNGLELLDHERSHAYRANRNPLKQWFSKQTHARFSRMAFAYTDAFVSLCELDRKHVLNLGLYPIERTAVVEPGLDEEYLSLPFIAQKQKRVAFMGTWNSRKGVDKLVSVMTRVLTQHRDLHFDIYGTGGAQDTVIAGFPVSLHDRITIYPRLSNQEIANGLVKAKVFFFPSQYEGFGIALAEAMACSCAVVTTPTGFGAELKHEQEAILCDFNDAEAMEYAVIRLLQDNDFQLKIAEQGWQRVRSLSWDSNIKKLAEVYSRWVEEYQESGSKNFL